MGVLVLVAVAAACIDAEILGAVQLSVAHLIIADHVGPNLVAIHRVRIIDHIGRVAAGRAHIDFQRNVIALFAKAGLVLVELEKLTVEEPALCAERLDGAEARILQRGGHSFLRPVAQIAVLTDDIQHRGGEHIGGVEQRHAMAVGHAVKADDGAVDIFLHNILHIMRLCIELFQFGKVIQLVGSLGTAAVVRLDDDRVADFLNKGSGLMQGADHMVTGHRHTGGNVAFLHLALVLDALDEVVLCAGRDVEIRAQLGIHFQPIFVVGLDPIDFAVVEGEVGDSTEHLVIVTEVVHAVILRQAVFQFPRNLVERRVADAQHIDTIAVQAVAEIPVGLGKMRADKDKIHRVLQLPLSIWGVSHKSVLLGVVLIADFGQSRTQRLLVGILAVAERIQRSVPVAQLGVDIAQ